MIHSFKSQAAEDIFHGRSTREARRVPQEVWKAAFRKLDILNAANTLQDLKAPPANRLEALKGNLKGKYSIRINDQYRIVFEFKDGNAFEVEIQDYH